LLTLSTAGVGALICSRHPDNRIGWILCALGLFGAFSEAAEGWGYFALRHDLPWGAGGEWLIFWSWILEGGGWALIFLLFPNGRLPSPRWWPWYWILGLGIVLALPGQALAPGHPSEFSGGSNPLGTTAIPTTMLLSSGMALLLVTIVAGLTALVLRFRRGTSVERQQLKWFGFAVAHLAVIFPATVVWYYDSLLIRILIALALVALPISAGISIFKYRLYDIDVVINRTLVYGALTITLAGLYAGSVLLLQLALSGLTEESGLAVAVSTLGVAALFRPARARIQAAVDRRFYRRRYDAARTVDDFRTRMRDEVALEWVVAELQRVVAETMQPARLSLWLRGPSHGP